MPNFENYPEEARRIEQEIARLGIALNIDWADKPAVHQLAREALTCNAEQMKLSLDDIESSTRQKLFGLAQLMLSVMAQSANEGVEVHGGPVWKAFGRALWAESGLPARSG